MVYVNEEFSPHILFVSTWMISVKILNVNAGCIMGAALINHLMYADDLVR